MLCSARARPPAPFAAEEGGGRTTPVPNASEPPRPEGQDGSPFHDGERREEGACYWYDFTISRRLGTLA